MPEINAEHSISELTQVVGQISEVASANAVVGPAQEKNGRIAVPLASVSAAYGVGFGFGESTEPDRDGVEEAVGGGGGGGGRGSARPVAVLEITETEVDVHQVVDSTRIALASLALAGWCVYWVTRTIRAFRRR